MPKSKWIVLAFAYVLGQCLYAQTNPSIPAAAWKRALGLALENPGTKMPTLERRHIDDGYWQGAPVGGFGAGTFSRSYRGDFVRWHLKTGVDRYQSIPLNRFSVFEQAEGSTPVATVLYSGQPPGQTGAWRFDYPVGVGSYYALYPKSWYEYDWDRLPARVTLEQFSPILPNNYKETSYPVAVYVWHAENPTAKKVTVSVMLSWANMIGWFHDSSPTFSQLTSQGNVNRFQSEELNGKGRPAQMQGIVFDRMRHGPVASEGDGQFVIAALETDRIHVTHVTTFLATDSERPAWLPFSSSGQLDDSDISWISGGETLEAAIAVTVTLEPHETISIPMVIAWDLPVVEFGNGRRWLRKYTDYFGDSGTNAWQIAKEALLHRVDWSLAIDNWQKSIVEDSSKPLWYRGALFNELYILADGGTLWGRPLGSDKTEPAQFAYLESYDYPMYGSLDVLFYGSMPLLRWWPDLDKQMLKAFAASVPTELSEKLLVRSDLIRKQQQVFRERKAMGAAAHDLGSPEEDPMFYVNNYGWQDSNLWKDLNSQFVLMVYRDFVLTGKSDTQFLKTTWPAVRGAILYMRKFDKDSDGVPENDGTADQTYDNWPAKGTMAYCGGLWLAALEASEQIAVVLRDKDSATEFQALFHKGQASYISKLWNGQYLRYDERGEYRDAIHADQLAGQLYANLLGLGEIVPKSMRLSTLRNIFENNVLKFGNGEMGAVNGIGPNGTLLTNNEQIQEVWSGTTHALAAEMITEGLRSEAFHTAQGAYRVVYETKGYWFRTPEAWDISGRFRASMAMRPGAIWAMEFALNSDVGNR